MIDDGPHFTTAVAMRERECAPGVIEDAILIKDANVAAMHYGRSESPSCARAPMIIPCHARRQDGDICKEGSFSRRYFVFGMTRRIERSQARDESYQHRRCRGGCLSSSFEMRRNMRVWLMLI